MKEETSAAQESSVFADANTLEKEEELVRKQREEYHKISEKDTIVFLSPVSFFRYRIEQPKGWVGRGKGSIRVSLEPTTKKYRIVHIKDKVYKLGCNHFIEEKIKLDKHPSEEHSWMWITRGDNCGDGLSPIQKYLAKFPTAEMAEAFYNTIEMIKKNDSLEDILKTSLFSPDAPEKSPKAPEPKSEKASEEKNTPRASPAQPEERDREASAKEDKPNSPEEDAPAPPKKASS